MVAWLLPLEKNETTAKLHEKSLWTSWDAYKHSESDGQFHDSIDVYATSYDNHVTTYMSVSKGKNTA